MGVLLFIVTQGWWRLNSFATRSCVTAAKEIAILLRKGDKTRRRLLP